MIKRDFNLIIRVPQQAYIETGVEVVQGDQNVYTINIRITDGIIDIDYAQINSATITFAKADGKVVQGDLVATGAGFTYEMGTNEIAYPGKVIASIQLYGDIDERLTTARFSFKVVQDLITPVAVQSTSEFPLLQKLLQDIEQLKTDIVNLEVSDGTLLDVKLSDAAGQIKDKVTTLQQTVISHTADNANPHNISIAQVGGSNKNLLHNWDWRKPVNKRGASGLKSTAGYTIDRWLLFAGSATFSDGYITLGTNSRLMQYFESSLLAGKTVTFSYLDDTGNVYHATSVLPSTNAFTDLPIQGGNFRTGKNATGNYTIFMPSSDIIVCAVKLELGSISTLAHDSPADFGEQLALCNRYYRLWTTAEARTEALKEVSLMRLASPTVGTIDIGGTTYYYASADL